MKLVAIWVENYMRIINQGFNFGSKNTFDFEFDIESRQLAINITETPDYYQPFSDDKITNITGVIGINGSGKTSLLKLLNVLKAKKSLTNSVVIVFENIKESSYEIIIYRSLQSKLSSRNNEMGISLPKKGIISKESEKLGLLSISESETPFSNIDIIFYSNLYSDQNDKYLGLNNQLNRSVNYQTHQSLSPYRIEKYIKEYNQSKKKKTILLEESFNILKLYDKDKTKRLFKFLSDVNSKHKNIKEIINKINFPNTISIWFDNNIFSETEKLIDRTLYHFDNLLKAHTYCFETNRLEQNLKKRFKNEIIYKLFFFAFYNDFFQQDKNRKSLNELELFVNNLSYEKTIYDELYNHLLTYDHPNTFYPIGKINQLLKNLDNLLEDLIVQVPESIFNEGSYEIYINDKLWHFLSEILAITDYNNDSLFQFSLTPFSAGETAILNQFSEFYEAFNYIEEDNIIVSIDEGELFLHPEWQRQYINSLYLFFNYFSSKLEVLKNKNIQFIVTSHSPFIASDIPKHNLIFLEKDKETGNCKVSNSTGHKPTFGGNVFELFSDGFFLKEFISEYAMNKINGAINFLNKGQDPSFKNLREVEMFTNLIGESLIREELQKMIERKKSKDFDKYYEIVRNDETSIDDNKKEEK